MASDQNDPETQELCDLIESVATRLVDNAEAVQVTGDRRGQMVRVHIDVHEDDMGRIIGREGRIARAMRTVLMIAASRRGLRSSLDIGN
ncbi:MAG: KH domain-containing protein [Thermomicrobiales bacterium]